MNMETILRAGAWMRATLSVALIASVVAVLALIVVRVVVGSRSHRLMVAFCTLPFAGMMAYCAVGGVLSWLSGHPGFAGLMALLTLQYGVGVFLLSRLARAL